ncbi:MAG: DEAD/DEAH box helicase [Planctomycetaceae bacterium]|jgi:ATP-dependent RNA helicase DeaD|nr:DEAD/DEAH box helicase [Planctomycetaceae bacterium]
MKTTKNNKNKNNKNNANNAANNRNNKSVRHAHAKQSDRHVDLVDSFQWGFVEGAENEENNEQNEFHTKSKSRKKSKKKTAQKNPAANSISPVTILPTQTSNTAAEKISAANPKSDKLNKSDKSKRSNLSKNKKKKKRQIITAPINNVTNITSDKFNTNPAGRIREKIVTETPVTDRTKNSNSKIHSTKSHSAKGNSKNARLKIDNQSERISLDTNQVKEPGNLLFEPFDDENDLNLPSYGRSYKNKNLNSDQKIKSDDSDNIVTKKSQTDKLPQSVLPPAASYSDSIKNSDIKNSDSAVQNLAPNSDLRNVKSSQSNYDSGKFNQNRFDNRMTSSSDLAKPKKEQMVWDPDKREYVPLKTSDQILSAQLYGTLNHTPEKTVRQPSVTKTTPQINKIPTVSTNNSTNGLSNNLSNNFTNNFTKTDIEKNNSSAIDKKVSGNIRVTQTVVTESDKPLSRSTQLPNKVNQRGDVPRLVSSKRPDPADIESDVSGFASLGLSDVMLEALRILRYIEPTPIQTGVFEKVKTGKDVMGQAQTGTGKTAAFSIPIIEGLEECPAGEEPVALILVPTRELAVQVRDEIVRLSYGRDIRIAACYGGKPIVKQITKLNSGIDIVVGTPGRVLDLINRRALLTNLLKWVVLDEADRMLDIGFRPDIEKILKKSPSTRQTLLFSATLPPPVVKLAERYMRDPEIMDFSNKHVSVDTIEQFYVTVDQERKFDALVYLLNEEQPNQAIIFTRTKRGADRLARLLSKQITSLSAIHGDLQQVERDRIMSKFRAGELRYLVATDVVGRGIDVSGISHIINYDIPHFCDDYVHRVGRTGRMGREGVAYTFVTAEEGNELTRIEMRIEKLLKRADLKGFESFSKPVQNKNDNTNNPNNNHKPVFGKHVRKIRKAL